MAVIERKIPKKGVTEYELFLELIQLITACILSELMDATIHKIFIFVRNTHVHYLCTPSMTNGYLLAGGISLSCLFLNNAVVAENMLCYEAKVT